VIELERHIEILLLSNDCVIVPGLGGFMTHHVSARYDEQDGVFLPPLRTLGFNPQLTMNDSLLVQSYVEVYDISYPEALRRIEAEVDELRQHLETEGQYEFYDLGTLRLNEEGNLEFEPCEAGILTPQFYGLSTFELAPLQKPQPKTGKDGSHSDHAITIKMSWLRNAAAVAAAVVAFLMMTTPVSNSHVSSDVQQSSFIPLPTQHATDITPVADEQAAPVDTTDAIVEEEAEVATVEEEVTTEEAEVTTGEAEEKASPAAEEATVSGPCYCIVLASQVTKHNAELFIGQLKEKGFNDARILETKFIRVVYGSYPSEREAYSQLNSLRTKDDHFREAWVMEMKN
jgi:hypothetical protein